jgi:hypothetical protein
MTPVMASNIDNVPISIFGIDQIAKRAWVNGVNKTVDQGPSYSDEKIDRDRTDQNIPVNDGGPDELRQRNYDDSDVKAYV